MVMLLDAGTRWKRSALSTCGRLVLAICCLGVSAVPGLLTVNPAAAVDLVNSGKESQTVTVIADGKSRTVTVAAGATIANVCDACTIKSNGASREASGDQRVTLAGSLLLVSGKPAETSAPN
ncbi:MAG: hypothetical protein SFV21_14195 [Rhodospirillaceae bacterium]|nr:hypothetical protein [Rhodospirillaceae bacterium]